MPVGVGHVRRGAPCRLGGLPLAQVHPARPGLLGRPGRRGWLRAVAAVQRGRGRGHPSRHRRRRLPARRGRRDRARPGHQLDLEPGTGVEGVTGRYRLEREGRTLESGELIDLWADWVNKYPIVSIEDGLAEDDWDAWPELTRRLGSRIQLMGDDLVVTNPQIIARAIRERAMNCVLIKLNQIGTLYRDDRRHRTGPKRRLDGSRSATARARPRTRPSPTSWSRWAPARSRAALHPDRSGWPSTTG